MSFLFNLIQVCGIILSAVGGALATFSDTRTRDKKHFTKFGWWAITLTAFGTVLALTAQIVLNTESEKQSRIVLNNLLRLETRFEHAEVTLSADVTPLDLTLTNLVPPSLLSLVNAPHTDIRKPFSLSGVMSENVVGFTDNGYLFSYGPSRADNSIDIPLQNQQLANFIEMGVSVAEAMDLSHFLTEPDLSMSFVGNGAAYNISGNLNLERLSKLSNDQLRQAHLPVVVTPGGSLVGQPKSIKFYPADNKIEVEWKFALDNMGDSYTHFACISDLPHDLIKLSIHGLPEDAIRRLKVNSIDLTLGDFSWGFTHEQAVVTGNAKDRSIDITFKSPLQDLFNR